MPNRNRTGPDGIFVDCVDPRIGRRRPLGMQFRRGRRGRRRRW